MASTTTALRSTIETQLREIDRLTQVNKGLEIELGRKNKVPDQDLFNTSGEPTTEGLKKFVSGRRAAFCQGYCSENKVKSVPGPIVDSFVGSVWADLESRGF